MKLSSWCLTAGLALPLIACPPSPAGVVGVKVRSARYPGPYIVFSVYMEFDRPGEDLMQAMAGTPQNTLIIDIIDGTIFQHSLGTNQAPSCAFLNIFPSLAYDTFVTIGVRAVGICAQPHDQLTLTPTFPHEIGPGPFVLTNDSWAVTPVNPQSNPFDPIFENGDGTVLIGQFTTTDGSAIEGTFLARHQSNESVTQSVREFEHHHCSEVDTDDDGLVAATDLLDVIGDWGCEGPDCPGDVSNDGVVNVRDFIDVFIFWGPCPG